MSAVPGSIDTEYQPPMAVPLRHFLVGLGFLLAGGVLGMAGGGLRTLAHVHALVLGWVCLTIMGAMTQFVPVWSGTRLHSRRLARLQLALVTAGLVGFLATLVAGRPDLLVVAGVVVLAGFWTFVYNVGRTLATVRPLDVTERHFAFALACLLVVTTFGLALAAGFRTPFLGGLRARVVSAHATLAVFGVVLGTVAGASYQLGTMFTQTDIEGVDATLQRVETAVYPLGVVLLAAARLLARPLLARVGAVFVVGGLALLAVVIGRRLLETRVAWTPMLRRYAAFSGALLLWCGLTLPAWLAAPLAPAARFGAPGATHLLLLGVVGAIVSGTLYHIVPFVVWVHRYSHRLGFESVPMIDDLYDDRLATGDLLAVGAGTALVVAAELFGGGLFGGGLATTARAVGGTLALAGFCLFVANLSLVVVRHAPGTISGRLAGPTTEE
ncbi:MAG: hypothetical protein ABEJ06_01730 [Haloarculaceae archaeon]